LAADSDSVNAEVVVGRAEAAQSALLDGLGPDSTLHIVQEAYRPHDIPAGPFVLPERYKLEWWAYFGSEGDLSSLRSETRDEATGAVVQTAEFTGGQLVITDTASGETNVVASFQPTTESLRHTLVNAQAETSALVDPGAAAKTANVHGKSAYVVEMVAGTDNRRIRRVYVDRVDYREVKWEILDADRTVIESRETPLIEIVRGELAPTQ
jgi:hypothetical protein